MALFMTLVTDTTMTLTVTLAMTGLDSGFLMRFLAGFVIRLHRRLPNKPIVLPDIRRIVDKLTAE